MAFNDTKHERSAQRAEQLAIETQGRYRRSRDREARSLELAETAVTDAERVRHEHMAAVHHEAAMCHRRATLLFELHRDHERDHVARQGQPALTTGRS